jgi:broad specificity phosphatase PhoE
MADGILRVGKTLERLAETHAGKDVIAVTHGGAIRCAVAHALRIGPDNALHLSVENISLTRLDRLGRGWRVACVNELPGV